MNKFSKYIIAGAILIAACYSVFIAHSAYSFRKHRNATLTAMNNMVFICPDGSIPKTSGWGFNGLSRYCFANGQKNGPWEAWDNQYMHIKGNYLKDKMDGDWAWFDKEGRRFRIVRYSQDKEISNEIIGK